MMFRKRIFEETFTNFLNFLFDVPKTPASFQSQLNNRKRRSQNEKIKIKLPIRSSGLMLSRTDNEFLLEILIVSFIKIYYYKKESHYLNLDP